MELVRRSFKIVIVLVVLIVTVSCASAPTSVSPTATIAPSVTPRLATPTDAPEPYGNVGTWQRDVVYCRPNGVALKMDIYIPNQRKRDPTPLLIYYHGLGGGKLGINPSTNFLQAGYVLGSVDYREKPTPLAIADAKCAVRFLRAQAAALHIDSKNIAAYGFSYGGFLSAMLAVTDTNVGWEGSGEYLEQSSHVQAVVPMAGNYDWNVYFFQGSELQDFFGTTSLQDPVLARSSPITYVSKNAPPFLMLHGEMDANYRLSQAQAMRDRLQAAGVPVTLVEFPYSDHNISLKPEHIKMMIDFFDQTLK